MKLLFIRWPCAAIISAFLVSGVARSTRAGDSQTDRSAIARQAELAASVMRLPSGYAAKAVASEPLLANPVAFCFDERGRIFVAETHRVRKGVEDNRWHMEWLDDDLASRTVGDRKAFLQRRMREQIGEYTEASDQVRLLEDCDEDGLYEHSSVFSTGYHDIETGAAAGVLWVDGRLLFTCIPALWELRDADDDGRADAKRALATGFGVHVALFGHDLHGLCEGPDGRIYFSIGDRGLNVATPDGRQLVNLHSGAVLRCHRDGSGLELFATGLRNPQELAFNELGDLFTVDNNSDSGDRARLVHVVEGMQAGWRMSYQYLPDRGPFNREKIWHTENDVQPASILPPIAHVSDGPSGLARYPGTGLPAENDGAFFLCDFLGMPTSSGVRRFWIEPQRATYCLKQEEMFAQGVLATDCSFGPDGALYITDWIDGWTGQGAGRIHQIASDDPAAVEAGLATGALLRQLPTQTGREAADLLSHDDARVRMAAQRRLVEGGVDSAARLWRVASDPKAPLLGRLHAVWGLGELAETSPQLFVDLASLCKDAEPEVRAQAAKTIGQATSREELQRERLGEALVPLLSDKEPRVRCFAAIALGKLAYEPSLDALLDMARRDAGEDATLRHAVAMGLAGSQPSERLAAAAVGATDSERLAIVIALGRQRSPLVGRFLSDPAPRVHLEAARLIWDMPIPEVYDDLAAILSDAPAGNEPLLRRSLAACSHLGGAVRLQLVIACGLRSGLSDAMRAHAWELVRNWSTPSSRDPVHGEWRPAAVRPESEAVAGLRAAFEDLIEASPTHPRGLIVAAELGLPEAAARLAIVLDNEAIAPPLRARGLAALTHADEPALRKVVEAALQSQAVEVRAAGRRLLAQRLPEVAVDLLGEAAQSGAVEERQEALALLGDLDHPAARVAIAQWLHRLEEGACSAELQLEVLEAAAKSSDPAIRARQEAFKHRLAAGGPVEGYAFCVDGGDAKRGRELFHNNAALSCRRCHAAESDEVLVGPNLADVGLRLPRQQILESIVAPNAKIADGFQTTALLTDAGQVVAGIVRSEDERRVVLVDAERAEHVVEADAVLERSAGLSAMPEDLMKLMTPRDLRDLVEYLSSLKNDLRKVGH